MCSEKSTIIDLQATPSGYHGIDTHISQIPGLSPTISMPPEGKSRGRRAGVVAGDSDYIKMAKQGGHKGLLWHENTSTSKNDAYKPPDWLWTPLEDNSKPIEEKKNPGAFQHSEPPFGTDNMSAWERDDSSSGNGKEKNNNFEYSQMEKVQPPYNYQQTSKFKRMVFNKNQAPVDMSKLLSFGYADDDKPLP